MEKHVMNDQYGVEDLLEQEKYLIHALFPKQPSRSFEAFLQII